jgi:hypothetical protein
MELFRSIAAHGSLRPRAENLIRAIPPAYLHYAAHGLKHPLTVYQTSLNRIQAAWLKVFPLLEKLRFEVMCDVELKHYKETLESYEALLYRLNEHIDAAHEVLRTLRAPATKEYRTHSDFLWATKLPGFRSFQDAIHKSYRNQLIGVIVNEMKHASAQLRAVCGNTESRTVLGYFLDGPHSPDSLGPNKKLHAKYGHLETAFSFSRDMLVHFWWVYQVSEALCRCVDATLHADHGISLTEAVPATSNPEWSSLCLLCSQIEPAFFLDECHKPYPISICPPDMSSIRLTFPTSRRPTSYRSINIKMLFTVSEQSRAFVMPYFQRQPRA